MPQATYLTYSRHICARCLWPQAALGCPSRRSRLPISPGPGNPCHSTTLVSLGRGESKITVILPSLTSCGILSATVMEGPKGLRI